MLTGQWSYRPSHWRGKNCRWQKSHKPISHCKFPSILLVDCVTKNRLFRKKKEKTYYHDNDKKSCRNNIICGSFYQRYSLILPSPSKLRHDFPQVISKKKVASLLYPSLSFKVSCLVLTFDLYLLKKKKNRHGFNFIRRNTSFRLITFMQFNFFLQCGFNQRC